jgi:copper transport protein
VVAFPLLRLLLHRRNDGRAHPVRAWWMVAAGLVGLGLAVTPGLGGHAGTGIQTGLAIPADMVHVAAMACWLGGLVVLCIAVLPRGDADELRAVLPRYSALALGAVVALIVSGGYQAWRQVGSIDALKSTDYGRLLIAKLVVFAALIVAAAFSREIVNRRFRDYPSDGERDDAETVFEPVPVAVGASVSGGGGSGSPPERHGRFDDDGYDGGWDDDTTDEDEVRRLRRSVAVEVVIAAVILSITALLVNAAPARSVETQPVSLTLKARQVWVYVDIAPGIAGPNDMHFTSLPTGGGPATIDDMSVQLTRPGEDLPPFTVPLQKLGNGHYYAPLYDIPYSGKWQMTIRVQLGPTDEAVLVSPFSVR